MAAARDAFWTHGFSATSLDDLSAATGMNRPSLYAAFGDKRAIYLTALRQQAEGMLNATTAALSAPWPLRRTLENFYTRAVGIYVGDAQNGRGCFLVGTALADAIDDADVREILNSSFAGMDAVMTARLEKAVADGDLPVQTDVSSLAFVAMSALHGLAIRSRAGFGKATLEGWARAAAAMVCGPEKA